MTLDPAVTRRAVLAAGAAGAGAAALAGCSSAGRASTGGAKERAGKRLAKLADVPVGRAAAVTLPDGSPGVVARPTTSTAVCFSAICTHQGCTAALHGRTLDCPCHGSRFDALTGAVLNGPASSPLWRIGVTVVDGEVVTT